VETPPVRFVSTADGYDIAYLEAGSGRPVVFIPGQFSNIAEAFTGPQGEWAVGLAAKHRLVMYDGRGQGSSTRGLGATESIDSLGRDLEAVVSELDLHGAVLLARWFASHLAIRFAAAHPDRIAGIILVTCSTDNTRWPTAIYQSLVDQNWDAFVVSQLPRGITMEAARGSISRIKRQTTRADLIARYHAYLNSDVEDLLPWISAPALVLHPRDHIFLPAENSMAVAARLPNARFAWIEGDTVPGDHVTGLAAVERFISELPAAQPPPAGEQGEAPSPTVLSGRELEVLKLIAAGSSNQEVADSLVLSINTVERHITHIYSKIGARNKAQATAYAHRLRLV
jgi:pimeloyl-ACP methyl ester carboxylesterase/DNA-binding CsgD family transcriptional regulator